MKRVLPSILSVQFLDNGALVLEFRLDSELPYFEGHFPQMPVLPGVVQLDWAVAWAREYLQFASGLPVRQLEVLKFQQLMLPGMQIQLELIRKDDHKCLFSYRSDKGQHASGRIVFGEQQ